MVAPLGLGACHGGYIGRVARVLTSGAILRVPYGPLFDARIYRTDQLCRFLPARALRFAYAGSDLGIATHSLHRHARTHTFTFFPP
jgi:hypothetical protein